MISRTFKYQKGKISKCLLIATLLFSFFSFSGFADVAGSYHQQGVKTELIFSNKYKAGKRVVSYKKAFDVYIYCPLNSSQENETYFLLAGNTLTKVRFKNISTQLYSFNTATRFFQLKTIPQDSIEDNHSLTIG